MQLNLSCAALSPVQSSPQCCRRLGGAVPLISRAYTDSPSASFCLAEPSPRSQTCLYVVPHCCRETLSYIFLTGAARKFPKPLAGHGWEKGKEGRRETWWPGGISGHLCLVCARGWAQGSGLVSCQAEKWHRKATSGEPGASVSTPGESVLRAISKDFYFQRGWINRTSGAASDDRLVCKIRCQQRNIFGTA